MIRQLLYFFLLFSINVFAQNQGDLSGRVIDGETGFGLEGATIQIENSDFYTITDQNGYFEITNIPTSSFNVTASFIGFKSLTKYNVIIKSAGNQSLQYILNPSSEILDEVIVVESPFRTSIETPLSTQTFSAVEIETYPGGNNDITRVIQSLPGISPSIGGFRNDIIIRGGGPNETVYYLDGIEIPNINHFSTQGSSGGPVGLINVSFIKDVTLSTSAFGAEYDNALSGCARSPRRWPIPSATAAPSLHAFTRPSPHAFTGRRGDGQPIRRRRDRSARRHLHQDVAAAGDTLRHGPQPRTHQLIA